MSISTMAAPAVLIVKLTSSMWTASSMGSKCNSEEARKGVPSGSLYSRIVFICFVCIVSLYFL